MTEQQSAPTSEQRAEWAALSAAATPGPWFNVADDLIGGRAVANVDKPCSEHGGRDSGEFALGDFMREPDASFVAASITAVPALLAENEQLRAQIAAMLASLDRQEAANSAYIRDGANPTTVASARMENRYIARLRALAASSGVSRTGDQK